MDAKTPMESQKHVKFIELAEKRTNKALENIRLLGNLSSKQNYSYTDAEVRKMIKALRDAISETEARFMKSTSKSGGEFKF